MVFTHNSTGATQRHGRHSLSDRSQAWNSGWQPHKMPDTERRLQPREKPDTEHRRGRRGPGSRPTWSWAERCPLRRWKRLAPQAGAACGCFCQTRHSTRVKWVHLRAGNNVASVVLSPKLDSLNLITGKHHKPRSRGIQQHSWSHPSTGQRVHLWP